jgi:DUF1680 family protein
MFCYSSLPFSEKLESKLPTSVASPSNVETMVSLRKTKSALRGYLTIGREWASGDIVELDLPMPAERIYAHPHVRVDVGRVALRRGPLVYCLEQHDNGTQPVSNLRLPRTADTQAVTRDDLFGGIVTLQAEGACAQSGDWAHDLYRATPPKEQPATLTAVPYYIWCNRGTNRMQVWTRE